MNLIFLEEIGESPVDYNQFIYSKNFNPGYYGVTATILYLQEMFILNKDLGYILYTDDTNKEESYKALWVGTKFQWEEKYRDKRPAALIYRGNLLNGANGTLGAGRVFSVSRTNEKTAYKDYVSFPIVVECISESDLEAEALSAMVTSFISLDLRSYRDLGLQVQGQVTNTAPQIFEKGNTSFTASTILQIQMERSYIARLLSKDLLTNIQLKLNGSTALNIE